MNKLDEELKAALRREEPSADFAYRVLARVRTLPPPKPAWRQRFLTLLRPPKLVWVGAGVAACLLIALGVQGLRGYERQRVENEKVVAKDNDRTAQPGPAITPEKPSSQPQPQINQNAAPERVIHNVVHHHHNTLRENPEEVEAREAMEQLKLALYIASTKLNAAQKAVYKAENPEE